MLTTSTIWSPWGGAAAGDPGSSSPPPPGCCLLRTVRRKLSKGTGLSSKCKEESKSENSRIEDLKRRRDPLGDTMTASDSLKFLRVKQNTVVTSLAAK